MSNGPEASNPSGRRKQGLSMALRMSIWYALSAFALVLVASAVLYWALSASVYQEDVRDLADNLNNARMLLDSSAPIDLQQVTVQRPSWAPAHQPEIYLRVFDERGQKLVETPSMSDQLPPPASSQIAAIPKTGSQQDEMVSRSGEHFLSLIVRVPGQSARPTYFMQVAMDREHDEFLLARYRNRLWLVLGISLIACALIGHLIARRGLQPIQRIAHTAERIRSTTLHERIAAQGLPAELSGLAETFNSMLDRLEESFERMSQFSNDVAHELRTPVNNLRGEIEVALSKARTGEDYRDILGSCLEECTRISGLIQRLLFLARAENEEPLEREEIDIGKELATVQEFYEAAAAEAGVSLRVAAAPGLTAHVDRTLLQQAIGNLVSNAIAHTPAGGSIELGARVERDQIVLHVTDTGCGIAAEHLPRVFERFYRVDPARSNAGQHVGLGLAVVKGIVTCHGGHTEIDSTVGQGTEVRMILPVAG